MKKNPVTPAASLQTHQTLEQSIVIAAGIDRVEDTITALEMMKHWLNPVLICEPIDGPWSTAVGAKSRFMVRIPGLNLVLQNQVVEREIGLVVWSFDGFFRGTDRWECQPHPEGTQLVNRFTFEIPNPIVRLGFTLFASTWTARDMQAQLQRIRAIAESDS